MSFKSIFVAGLAAVTFSAAAHAGEGLEVHDAYVRAANTKAGAAFMVIHNHGDTDDRLIGVASSVSKKVELHTHEEDANGVMRMMHVEDGFELPAGGEIVMQRGGYHVMFMGLNDPLEQGEMVPLTLIFEKGGEMDIEVPVDLERKPKHGEGHKVDGHDHSHDHSHSDS